MLIQHGISRWASIGFCQPAHRVGQAFGVDYGVQYGFPKNVRIVAQVEAVKQ